jgi:hypothetical protein
VVPLLFLATTIAAVPNSPQVLVDSVWYRTTDVRDLTGDGAQDTLVLEVTGTRPDSSRITFDIVSQGRHLYHDSWLSAGYFDYDTPAGLPESAKYTAVLDQLRSFFRRDRYGTVDTVRAPSRWDPTDGADPRSEIAFHLNYGRALDSLLGAGVAQDSAQVQAARYAWSAPTDSQSIGRVWREIVQRHATTFTYYTGGEAGYVIVWSAVLRRFVVIFSCC